MCLAVITAVLITVFGIIYNQPVIRIIPLYVSLTVGLLQSTANRYASLIGGLNSLLYAFVYYILGLYASAGYALIFSFPVQIATFIRWSKNSYRSSTQFRSMTNLQRLLVLIGFAVCFAVLYVILGMLGSDYQLLDNISSLMGILISFLTMLAYIEYSWLMIPSGIITIMLNLQTMVNHPGQITYLIFSLYSIICIIRGFFSVRRLYREQKSDEKPYNDVRCS